MNTSNLLSKLLVLHLTALVVMAGTTIIDFLGYQTFWRLYDQKRGKSFGVLQLLNRFARLLGHRCCTAGRFWNRYNCGYPWRSCRKTLVQNQIRLGYSTDWQ
jgi:hypothetical protein